MFLAGAIHYQVGFCASDRYYTPLPLYHTAGGAMCVGQAVVYGSTVVIRKKFSASGYFSDIAKYKCTVSITLIFCFVMFDFLLAHQTLLNISVATQAIKYYVFPLMLLKLCIIFFFFTSKD